MITSSATFLVLLVFRFAPNTSVVPQIVLIVGFYSVVTAIASYFLLDLRLSTTQWIGVGLSAVALFLINWKS